MSHNVNKCENCVKNNMPSNKFIQYLFKMSIAHTICWVTYRLCVHACIESQQQQPECDVHYMITFNIHADKTNV